jgi:hypothetical protein
MDHPENDPMRRIASRLTAALGSDGLVARFR